MVTADSLLATIKPYISLIAGYVYLVGQFLLTILGIVYVIGLFTYNVKVVIHEYTKGGKTVVRNTRAREIHDKKNDNPQLKLFDFSLFMGKKINLPPSECIFPYKSFFAKKIYYFVLKDGSYIPIQNLVIGKKYQLKDKEGKIQEVYSTEGTGLETSRDYDTEQAILNNLHEAAIKYRNKKPVEIVAMYGLMCIVIIGSIVIIVYSLKQVGNLFDALNSLGKPIEEGVKSAVQQRLGPG